MPRKIILLSGPVCAGKSTLADGLIERYSNFPIHHVKSNELLFQRNAQLEESRSDLQAFGETLDRQTKGGWVRDDIQKLIASNVDFKNSILIVDAVRIEKQIEAFRESYGTKVVHIHLTAPDNVVAQRYQERSKNAGKIKELSSYGDVRRAADENLPRN